MTGMRIDYFLIPVGQDATLVCVGSGVLGGIALTNTSAGTADTVTLWDGGGPGGRQIAALTLPGGAAVFGSLSHDGVRFAHGLYVTTGGLIAGSVFAGLDALQPVTRD